MEMAISPPQHTAKAASDCSGDEQAALGFELARLSPAKPPGSSTAAGSPPPSAKRTRYRTPSKRNPRITSCSEDSFARLDTTAQSHSAAERTHQKGTST